MSIKKVKRVVNFIVITGSWIDTWINSFRLLSLLTSHNNCVSFNFGPELIMPALISMFRDRQSLSLWKPFIPIVLLNPFMHAHSCYASVYFATFTRNLSVVSVLKADRTPCCCRQLWRTAVDLRWLNPVILWGYHPTLKHAGIPTFTLIVSLTYSMDNI